MVSGRLVSLLVFFRVTRSAKSESFSTFHGSSKPGNRSFGRFSRPLLEGYFNNLIQTCNKGKSLVVAEIFCYFKGFCRLYSCFCLLDQKYKRGVVRTLLSPKHCRIKNVKWTTSTIGDIGSFIKGAPLSKADISSDGTPFILYGELYTTYNEVITTVVRKTQASVDKQYYSQIGDVIIPTSGETPEEISTASCVMLPDIILAGDLNIYRCTQVDGRIMSYILNHVVNDRIARVAQGKSIVHVQSAEISKIEITYPDQLSQKRIIAILAAITERIEQNVRELELLQDQRKAFLQRLFI